VNFEQDSRGHWKAFVLCAIFLRLLGLNSSQHVVELGHILNEGVWLGPEDLVKSDP
jgi:hypothetical protein